MTCKVMVDPAVFFIPAHTRDTAILEAKLQAMALWSRVLTDHADVFCISERCVESLYVHGYGPTLSRLSSLLRTHNVDSVDAVTLARAAERIISHEPYLERLVGVEDILIDESRTQILPAHLVNRLPPEMQMSWSESLGICAWHNSQDSNSIVALASLWEDTEPPPQEVSGAIFVRMVATPENSIIVEDGLPLLLKLYLDYVQADIDLSEMDPHDAVVASFQSYMGESFTGYSLGPYRFHPEFAESLRSLNLHHLPSVLRAVYRKACWIASGVATHLRGAELHWIEEPKGGPQKVRKSDGAKAWRCQIEKHGPGYQLHYWLCPDNTVEFAVVVQHGSIYIPE